MTFRFTFSGSRAALESASDILSEALHPPADALSLTKSDPTVEDDRAEWRLDAYFEVRPDQEALSAALGRIGLAAPAAEELPDIDWVAHALEGLGVVRCGQFVLYGTHDADKVKSEQHVVAIRIDANQAFGTGHHPTTAGCLILLDRLAGLAPSRILDLGTGSAVLAIAAAKLWGRDVLATDIDAKSVEIARENVTLNGADGRVIVLQADGLSGADIESASPFDFIFANILSGPLVEFAPAMASRTARNGRVMLAGFMADQEAEVASAYEAAGFRKLNRLDYDAWPILLFARR